MLATGDKQDDKEGYSIDALEANGEHDAAVRSQESVVPPPPPPFEAEVGGHGTATDPPCPSQETIATAAALSRRAASAEEVVGGTRALDEYSDTDQDDSGLELDGRTMMDIGKFKGQKTLAQVYTDDKSYVQWVRNHKKGTQMSTGEDLCGAARRREVQSSGKPPDEERSGRPCQGDRRQEERDPGDGVGERRGIGIQRKHADLGQDQVGQPGPHGIRHVGARGGTDNHGPAVGKYDGRDDDQGRRVARQHCQSEPSGRGESEAVDDSGTEGIEVNRKTRRRLQRSAKKWANAHEAHVVEPWESPVSETFSVFMSL